MKVELLRPIAGKAYFEGDTVEVSDEQARAWIESGHAIPAMAKAVPDTQPSTTQAPQPLSAETTSVLVAKGRGRKK
jgi:hypothetical protein